MKKILLLVTMVLGLWACSTDNEGDLGQYGYNAVEKSNTPEMEVFSTTSCFTDLVANVHVDVSGGFGNPIVVFTPVVNGTVSPTATFRVKVEVQPLSDCDDMNSNTGTLLSFGPAGLVQNVVASPPALYVQPGSLPLCYKWRFVFEGIAGTQRNPTCYSASIWYESPLF